MRYLQIGAIVVFYFATSAAFANHLTKDAPSSGEGVPMHKVLPKSKIPKDVVAPKNPAPPKGMKNTVPPKDLYNEEYKAK